MYLDDPNPVIYSPGAFTDSVSTSKGDPDYCGVRRFDFRRTDTNAVINLIIEMPDGTWRIQATSAFFTLEVVPVEVRVTVDHVHYSAVEEIFNF